MKPYPLILALCSVLGVTAPGQTVSSAQPVASPSVATAARGRATAQPRNWVLQDIGPHSRTWVATNADESPSAAVANPASTTAANSPRAGAAPGNASPREHRVIELATGMNYWSEDAKQWLPSVPSFQVTEDAFVADKVQHRVRLLADLNAAGAVTTATPDGVTLRSTPVAIVLYDAASGNSLVVGAITNCSGVLVGSNQVVYANAFCGVSADIVYSIARGSFDQDVVLTGQSRSRRLWLPDQHDPHPNPDGVL